MLSGAAGLLREAGVESPEHDAAELLAHVLGTTRSRLALVDDVPLEAVATYDALLARRAAREPLQHLTGMADFRHVELAGRPRRLRAAPGDRAAGRLGGRPGR